MPTLINGGGPGAASVQTGIQSAGAPRALSTAGDTADVASAIKVLSDALRSGSGSLRLKNKTGTLAEKKALLTLAGSTVALTKRDATQYFGVFNATPDATPTWGELVVVINA